MIAADFEEAGHDGVIRKVVGDLGDKADEQTIRAKRREALAAAKEELATEA